MRILSITAQKPDSTGSGIYLSHLQHAFEKAGHDVALIYGCDVHDAYTFTYPTFPVVFNTSRVNFPVVGMSDTMPYTSSIYRNLTPVQLDVFEHEFRRVLLTARKEFKPDVVICHHLYGVMTLAYDVFKACSASAPSAAGCDDTYETMSGTPHIPHMIAICHGSDLRQLRTHHLFYERVRACLSKFDAVIALHENQKIQITSLFPEACKCVYALGAAFDSALFRYSDTLQAVLSSSTGNSLSVHAAHQQHSSGVKPRTFNLCYVGKISYKKGVHSLLRSLAIDDTSRIAKLSLIGGSGSTDEWRQVRNLAHCLPFPVHMLGALSQEQVALHYQSSDIFVLASYYEGLPLCVIEALACGCAVVCSNTAGLHDWITRHIPHALCYFVDLPAEREVGVPVRSELPRYEAHFKDAIDTMIDTLLNETDAQRIQRLQHTQHELSALTWDALAKRILDVGACE